MTPDPLHPLFIPGRAANCHAAKMHPPDTAPKDENFLGYFGYPWWNMTRWNEASQKWATAEMQIGMVEGEWNDTYFETEYNPPADLRGWMPLPTLPVK